VAVIRAILAHPRRVPEPAREPTLEELWGSTPPPGAPLGHDALARVPPAARRYLMHAVAPGAPRATAVRLRMHGEIRLAGWAPFRAEEVLRRDRGLFWRSVVRMRGLPVRGFDRLVDGQAHMRWRLLGLVPLLTATGPDVARSAAGRWAAELVWLPSALGGEDVTWRAVGAARVRAELRLGGEPQALELSLGDDGAVRRVGLDRWGNPGGGPFRLHPFGAVVEAERTFGDYTIPSRLRVGWQLGPSRGTDDGEFFRVTIDEASYR
jgi:hypothetical protein